MKPLEKLKMNEDFTANICAAIKTKYDSLRSVTDSMKQTSVLAALTTCLAYFIKEFCCEEKKINDTYLEINKTMLELLNIKGENNDPSL